MKDKEITDKFYVKIQEEIDRIQKKSKKYTRFFFFTRMILIGAGAAITILSGLKVSLQVGTDDATPSYLNAGSVILVLGTFVTAITATETLFQFDDKRTTYKLILFELRSIRAEVVLRSLKATLQQPLQTDDLHDRYRITLSHARSLIDTEVNSGR